MAYDPNATVAANALAWSLVLDGLDAAQDATEAALDALEARVVVLEGAEPVEPPQPANTLSNTLTDSTLDNTSVQNFGATFGPMRADLIAAGRSVAPFGSRSVVAILTEMDAASEPAEEPVDPPANPNMTEYGAIAIQGTAQTPIKTVTDRPVRMIAGDYIADSGRILTAEFRVIADDDTFKRIRIAKQSDAVHYKLGLFHFDGPTGFSNQDLLGPTSPRAKICVTLSAAGGLEFTWIDEDGVEEYAEYINPEVCKQQFGNDFPNGNRFQIGFGGNNEGDGTLTYTAIGTDA